jgi:hypothetical protein
MLNLALSIRQPWAWAIVHAGKDVENRDWPTDLRGRFFIQAAKGMSGLEYREFRAFYEDTIRTRQPELPPCPLIKDLDRGGIIGTAELVDCVRDHASPWFTGKYGFVLANATPLPFRPLTGQLGFFKVDAT